MASIYRVRNLIANLNGDCVKMLTREDRGRVYRGIVESGSRIHAASAPCPSIAVQDPASSPYRLVKNHISATSSRKIAPNTIFLKRPTFLGPRS